MNINVDAVLIVSGMIFLTWVGGMGALMLMGRRNDREFREEMDRIRADRG
ncbi:hypothetical protein [Sphingomonas sp.]